MTKPSPEQQAIYIEWRNEIRRSLKKLKRDELAALLQSPPLQSDLPAPIDQLLRIEAAEESFDRFCRLVAFGQLKDYRASHYECRLAVMVWALREGRVASSIHGSLPDRPGIASAHALATIASDPDRYMPGGTFHMPEGSFSPQGKAKESDPVGNGVRWLTRLRKDVANGESRGELISMLLSILDQTIAEKRYLWVDM